MLACALTVAFAAKARRDEARALSAWATLREPLAQLNTTGPGPHRVLLNEQPVTVGITTAEGTVDDALDAVARACGSSDVDLAMGLPQAADDSAAPRPRVRLAGIRRESARELGAIRCTFHDDAERTSQARADPADEAAPRARYVVARSRGHAVEMLSVTTETETALASLFPERGDAPGSDPPDGARPSGSRRLLTARVAGSASAVRLYEVDEPLAPTLATYDRASAAAGWVTSVAVSAAMPTTRLLSRGADELVVSFDALPTTTFIAVVSSPFGRADAATNAHAARPVRASPQ